MVDFGLIDEWNPPPGRLVTWVAAPESVARAAQAPVHLAPPSHQQEQYLRWPIGTLPPTSATPDYVWSPPRYRWVISTRMQ
ncbi:hypothetical protein [Nocardia sp. NPDC049526]|uniref:hypothetical protein n=1 Tax=Nocardia sp. NPDC049526 TaxID=3364316 RepID=UPI0037A23F0E